MPASHFSPPDLPCTSAKPSRRRSSIRLRPPAVGSRGSKGETRSSGLRSEEHTSELQSLMRISYAVFCLKKKNYIKKHHKKRIKKKNKQTTYTQNTPTLNI